MQIMQNNGYISGGKQRRKLCCKKNVYFLIIYSKIQKYKNKCPKMNKFSHVFSFILCNKKKLKIYLAKNLFLIFFIFNSFQHFLLYASEELLKQIVIHLKYLYNQFNKQILAISDKVMAQHISDKILGLAGAAGSLVASIFLSPPKFVWGLSGLVVATTSLGIFLKNRWVESSPNEWLLVIRNGKLHKAGVGLKTFVGLADTVVKFPSRVQRIQFTANNVTKEMQGVVINGFAFWSVYRDDDGPFRCYKYMEGGDANSNVQAMCESALRNLIANSTLDDVLKNRNHLRDNMQKDLKDQFKGWGIWLQTVEITQVKISSNRLFEDLQAEFRQDARLKADRIELITKEQMTQSRQESQMKTTKCEQQNNTKRQQTRNNQQLKRELQTANFQQKKNELELAKLQRDKDFAIQKLKTQLQQDQQRLSNENKIKSIQQDFELQFMRKKLELDRLHDDKTLQKYQIDTMERIYQKLGVKEIKINQFVGDGKSSLASILPGMGFAMGQMKTSE